jgi:FkbM family methyltransferase
MGITSYAQNFEDVMLWRALSQVEHGFYIDIGAQDPLVDSVSLLFHEHGWHGIHVEPIRQYADLLKEQRPGDIVIQAAVGSAPSVLPFFEIPGTGISTADPDIAAQHRRRGFDVHETIVTCIPLSAVFASAPTPEIHWLKIDVEGFEAQVISSWGQTSAKPWIVVVESTLPLTQIDSYASWEGMLIARGYSPVYFDGLNRYYLSNTHPELTSAFRTPPNVFDDVALSGTANSTLHRGIQARFEHLQEESRAQLETLTRSFEHEAVLLRESNAAEVVAHAQREQDLQQQLALGRHEADRLRHKLTQCERDFSMQLQVTQEQAARERTERDRRIGHLLREVERLRQELAVTKSDSEGAIAAKKQELMQSETARRDAQRSFSRQLGLLRSALGARTALLSALQLELAKTRGTISWRLTGPIRYLEQRLARNAPAPLSYDHGISDQEVLAPEYLFASKHRGALTMTDHTISGSPSFSGDFSAQDITTLLHLQEDDFIECAYRTILRREPDAEGENHFRSMLQQGKSRFLILQHLYFSDEAKQINVSLPWLKRALRRDQLSHTPIIGWLMALFPRTSSRIDIETRLQALEQQVLIIGRQLAMTDRSAASSESDSERPGHALPSRSAPSRHVGDDEPDLSAMPVVARRIYRELVKATAEAQARAPLKQTRARA